MAERLLAGQGAGPGAPSGHQALERVLAAAARPATRRELSGEAAAVAAFLLAARTNVGHGSGARHRRPSSQQERGDSGHLSRQFPLGGGPGRRREHPFQGLLTGRGTGTRTPASQQSLGHRLLGR